jgi:hypothetical protein
MKNNFIEPNKEFKFDGKIYKFDENGKLFTKILNEDVNWVKVSHLYEGKLFHYIIYKNKEAKSKKHGN